MPLINDNTYKPPFWLFNGHFETIYPAFFRKISIPVNPEKKIINTPDSDQFELNYYNYNSDKTVIISHGLEGNNTKPYIIGMAKIFIKNGWNVVAWSYRGCNGKINNSLKSYHSGFTEDIEQVINFADRPEIHTISLVGFSLGGNITLFYLGTSKHLNDKIKSSVAISVPMDLHAGCTEISKTKNLMYSKRFLRTMKKKIREKGRQFPELDIKPLSKVTNLKTFDDYYTAPLHGFKDALHYYQSCSSINVLKHIKVPTLIINAKNDPFLPKECYPYELVKNNPVVYLETPPRGGHVGFCTSNGSEFYWSEMRTFDFISSSI